MLQKKLNIGFNGHDEVPPVPRATRTPRRRLPCRKRADDDQMCAFDLLATVAGRLLEGESTPSAPELLTGEDKIAVGIDFVKEEKVAEENPEKVSLYQKKDHGRILIVSDIIPQAPKATQDIKEVSHVQNDARSAFASVITTSDSPEMFGSAANSVNDESKIEYGNLSKVDADHYCSATSLSSLDVKSKNCMIIEPLLSGKNPSRAGDDTCIEDLILQDVKPHVRGDPDNIVKLLVNPSVLDRSSQKALLRDQSPCGFFPACRDNVNLVRDDDENSSWCTPPRKLNKAFRPPARNGDRRIKRLLVSRYWKATPKSSNRDGFDTGFNTKNIYNNRVNCYKRQRSLRDYPVKKRKLYHRTFTRNAYERVNKNDSSFSPGKGYGVNASGTIATMHEANGTSTFAASPQKCVQTNDSHVKLKIKSFRVPELFFEIPETTTVGSLKRTVMEAVTAILGGGLCVGVLVKGKKIRDDNKTLVQTGIYEYNRTDGLGFTLEPLSSEVPSAQCPEDHLFIPPEELTRCPHGTIIVKQGDSDVLPAIRETKFLDCLKGDHDSAPSPPGMSIDRCVTDSRALVGGPQMNAEVLSAVPMRNSKKLDVGQRRIRRPFSVSEVQALVHAVEKLGTGRWCDVKIRAFDNAKHRTYVDLKDKWKTLVHTARISPQQRRGEPVPQELLDRVLAAHAFWSQKQVKQQSEACLLF